MSHKFILGQTGLLAIAVVTAITGCSKKTETSTVTAPTVDATSAAPVAAPAPVQQFVQIAPSTDVAKSLADADAAIKAKAYDQAVQNLLAVQKQKQLTDQQAAEARNRMVGLQQNLAQAMANGDPRAKAAVELLRQSSMH